MQNVFPVNEIVEFEEIYGVKRESATPFRNTKTCVFDKQKNEYAYADTTKYDWYKENEISEYEKSVFNDMQDTYLNIRNILVANYKRSLHYISLQAAYKLAGKYSFWHIYRVHTFLDKLRLINNRDMMQDICCLLSSAKSDDPVQKDISIPDRSVLANAVCICDKAAEYYNTRFDNNTVICDECLKTGKYNIKYTTSDFYKINKQAVKKMWSKIEEIKLLEGIELYNDDWTKVALNVGSKSKHECIYHFVMMSILETGLSDTGFSTLVPFILSTNSITHIIVFIASVIHPSIAATVAKLVINEISNPNQNLIKNMLLAAKKSCADYISLEERKIQRLENVLKECYVNIIIAKIKSLRNLYSRITKVQEELLNEEEIQL